MIIESKRIGCLDGLRGLAALWVLLGHSLQLTGWHLPILSSPDLGVDLFIMLSGFLMVFHYRLRESANPWEAIHLVRLLAEALFPNCATLLRDAVHRPVAGAAALCEPDGH